MAHQLTKAAEQVTYRQLCLLKIAVVKDNFGLRAEVSCVMLYENGIPRFIRLLFS